MATSDPDATRERKATKRPGEVDLNIHLSPINLNFHHVPDPGQLAALNQIGQALNHILQGVNKIMATQAEAAAQLAQVKQQLADTKAIVEKVGNETDGLLDKIQVLTDAAANAGNVSPELQAAIDDVATAGQSVKDAAVVDDTKVADATTTGTAGGV